ncbi:MAG: hypothetical protein GY953_26665 [bacterium]|nr:hypothetical protein [bacterium]
MPEVQPTHRKRFYEIRWALTARPAASGERFSEDRDEAFDYYERRQTEIDPRHVHLPIPSEEDDHVWVVLVELA